MADDDANEIRIEERFVPDLVATMANITDASWQPDRLWTYKNSAFELPYPDQLS